MGNYFVAFADRPKYMKSPNFDDLEACGRYVCEVGAHPFCAIVSIGPIGVGKSSNLNTIASFLNSHLEQEAGCGVGTESMTREKKLHTISYQGRPVKWKWLDTPGDLFQELVEMRKGVAANCMTTAQYDKHVDEVIIEPMRYHRAGCVMAMLSAVEVSNSVLHVDSRGNPLGRPLIDPMCRLKTNLQVLKHLSARLVREGMRMLVVLTKVDLIDKEIDEDVSNVAYSRAVDIMRSAISVETGVPLNQVHVVVNLVKDFDPMDNLPLGQLALFNVRAALHAARHYQSPASHPSRAHSAANWDTLTYPTSLDGVDTAMGRSHKLHGGQGSANGIHPGYAHPDADLEDDLERRSMGTFSEACTDIDSVLMAEAHRSVSEHGARNLAVS